jgi:hypothetical protein
VQPNIKMTNHVFFYLGLSLIMMHEMDAIRCKEWRIFPGMSFLNDDIGFKVFMFAHVPLYYYIFSSLYGENNENFIYGFSIFLVIHLGLHLLFLMHKKNEFKDWVSWIIISGAGVCGLIEIMLT